MWDPTNKFVVVPDLGTDHWMLYSFNAEGEMHPLPTPSFPTPAGSGPRHFAFHPSLPYAYGVSELASTVTAFKVDANANLLQQIQVMSTLPSPLSSAVAEVQFSHDGKILYVSNRIANTNGTLAVFNIDQTRGTLTSVGYSSTGGVHPRFFNLSKDGKFVLVANQISGDVKVFERNANGLLGSQVGSISKLDQPSHILQL